MSSRSREGVSNIPAAILGLLILAAALTPAFGGNAATPAAV
ncbi:MAG: hypothetical protein OXC14_02840 [Rhodospirillaceae bacterium]|nr:hypothetical protein [Rhodospirillaceae bacterium]